MEMEYLDKRLAEIKAQRKEIDKLVKKNCRIGVVWIIVYIILIVASVAVLEFLI